MSSTTATAAANTNVVSNARNLSPVRAPSPPWYASNPIDVPSAQAASARAPTPVETSTPPRAEPVKVTKPKREINWTATINHLTATLSNKELPPHLVVLAYRNFLEMFIKHQKGIIEDRKADRAKIAPMTQATLLELFNSLQKPLLDACGVIAGSAVTEAIKWRNGPGDIDIWLPKNKYHIGLNLEELGWQQMSFYEVQNDHTSMPKDIGYIVSYWHPDWPICLQVIMTSLPNVMTIIERFDFSVAKAVWSPALAKDGTVIGLRATHPAVKADIMAGVTTYTCRPWDLTKDGSTLAPKALNRIRKYLHKGFEFTVVQDPTSKANFTREQIDTMLATQSEASKSGPDSFYSGNITSIDNLEKEATKASYIASTLPEGHSIRTIAYMYEEYYNAYEEKSEFDVEDLPHYAAHKHRYAAMDAMRQVEQKKRDVEARAALVVMYE